MDIPLLNADPFSDTDEEDSGHYHFDLPRPLKKRRIQSDPIREHLFQCQTDTDRREKDRQALRQRAFHDFDDWGDLLHKSVTIFDERDNLEQKAAEIQSRESLINADCQRESRDGDLRLDALESVFDYFHMQPSELQRRCQWKFTNTVLPLIYGDSWEANRDRVMQERWLTKVKQRAMVSAPRRFGKTVATAQWLVACILNIPGIQIAVISTGQRAAGWLTDKISKALKDIPGAAERVVQETTTTIAMANRPLPPDCSQYSSVARSMNQEHTTSRITSYPCTVNSKYFIG